MMCAPASLKPAINRCMLGISRFSIRSNRYCADSMLPCSANNLPNPISRLPVAFCISMISSAVRLGSSENC